MEKAKIFNWKIIIPLGIILGVLMIFFMDRPKTGYRSETEILAIPTNQMLADNFSQVAGNLEQIPMTLGFYNKLLELYPDIEDQYAGMSPAQRKQAWNNDLDVGQKEKSNVISVKVSNPNQWQAELIGQKVSSDIISIANRYYNSEYQQLNLRIIDNPVTSSVVKSSKWTSRVFPAFVIGFLIAILISVLIGVIKNLLAPKTPEPELPSGDVWKKYSEKDEPDVTTMESDLKKSDTEEVTVMETPSDEEELPIFTPTIKPTEDRLQPDLTKKAKAPQNLPVAQEAVPSIFSQEKKQAEPIPEKPKAYYREASPEEVKERLNKLLRGD